MSEHNFILQPGEWKGEGRVTFSAAPDQIHFSTTWKTEQENPSVIRGEQVVNMEGTAEPVHNYFKFTDVTKNGFNVELENQTLGKVKGVGIIDEKTIAWEFRDNPGFEGFEIYKKQENGEYTIHSEYASPDQFRTIIDGHISKT